MISSVGYQRSELVLARLMGQYCFARCRLLALSIVVCNTAGGRAGRPRGRSGGRHCTMVQYGYVPLGRHCLTSLCYMVGCQE